MLGIRYRWRSLGTATRRNAAGAVALPQEETNRSWRQKIEAEIREWKRIREAQARVTARPLNPAYVFWELNPRIPERAIFTVDTAARRRGTRATWTCAQA